MAKRVLEVQIIGETQKLNAAFASANRSSDKFAKNTEHVHARVRKSFAGMTLSAAKTGAAIGGAYLGIAGAKDAISTTEELAHTTLGLHKNLGLSIKSASEWAAVAKARNIDSKALNMSFGTLSKNVKAATDGGKAQSAAFKELGVTQGALKSQNFDRILGQVSDGLSHVKGGTEKTALAMKLFGRGWQTVVPVLREGSKAMNEQLQLADKYGVTFKGKTVKSLEDLIKAQRESKFATMGLQVAFGTFLAPALTKAMTAVNHFVQGVRDGTGAGGRFADKMKAVWGSLQPLIAALRTTVKFLGQHPALLKAAAIAWVTYKTIAVSEIAKTKLAMLGLFSPASTAATEAKAGAAGARTGGVWKRAFLRASAVGIGLELAQALAPSFNQALESLTGQINASDPTNGRGQQRADQRTAKKYGGGGQSIPRLQKTAPKYLPKVPKKIRAGTSSVGNPGLMASASSSGNSVVQTILAVGRSMGASKKQIAAALETGIVESGLKNLNYGDADSLGWRQERVSIYGRQHATSVTLSAQDFFKEAMGMDNAGLTSGQLAANVQRPRADLRGKYAAVQAQALALLGGGSFGSGKGGKRSGPTPAQLRALAKKNAGTKSGALSTLGRILGGKGPMAPAFALPTLAAFSNDMFSSDALLTALQGSATSLQGSFDAQDRAATGAGLRGTLKNTSAAVRNAGAGKGESADSFSKRMGGLVQKVRDAKNALNAFTKEGQRAAALKTIDIKIKGVEQAKAFKEAIGGIRKGLSDAAKAAADAFRTLREGQISAAHDAALKSIAEGADAQELARLQAQDATEQDAKTTAQLNQDLADAIKSHDVKAQEDAQDAIDAYKRQKREQQLTDNIAAATQAADDAQTVAMNGLDQEVADFQSALDYKLQAEADQLEKRKENYATFLKNVQDIAGGYGISVADVIGSSADQEATVNGGPGSGSSGSSSSGSGSGTRFPTYSLGSSGPHYYLGGRASGGPVRAGVPYIVGESGQELFVPSQSGKIVSNGAWGGRGYTVNGPLIGHAEIKHPVDVERVVSRLAFRLG